MTQLLAKAFAEVGKLPDLEQNALAKWLLGEISSEKNWGKSFSASEEALEKLADEALTEHKKKRTRPLDPDRL